MIIEEELNQVRRVQRSDWELTRYHLRMARQGISLENLTRSHTFSTLVDMNGFDDKDPRHM